MGWQLEMKEKYSKRNFTVGGKFPTTQKENFDHSVITALELEADFDT